MVRLLLNTKGPTTPAMHRRMDISPPLALSCYDDSIKPLVLREKELPPTPISPRVVALEAENEALRSQIRALRGELEWSSRQVERYRQVAEAAKSFSKDVMFGVRHLQDAAFKMKGVEKNARKEWTDFQGGVEEETLRKNGTNNFF